MSNSKYSYLNVPNAFWTGKYINYQGLIGRPILNWPMIDFMSIFAEKKAHILVQSAKFIYKDTIKQEVKEFLMKINLTELLQNAIQQASMNGYAVLDIERIVWKGEAKTYLYVNPFPSTYDQWNFDTLTNKVNVVAFQTCLNTQRFKTPNIALFSKDNEKFNIMNFTGPQEAIFMIGGWGFDTTVKEPMSYFTNPKLLSKTIYYSDLWYTNARTNAKERIWPYVNDNHAPFYLFRNRQFTLGYKNEVQNSDMWFLNNMGYLIPSALERSFQEQEMNITRIIGALDPQLMPVNEMASSTDKILHNQGDFATSRAIQFTLGDGQQVQQTGSTFNGSIEAQNLKDWFDIAFKLCIGFDLFGESATRESTATENLQRSVSERENLVVLTDFYKKQIKEAIGEALFYTFGDTFLEEFEIHLDNQRGSVSPSEVQSILSIYGQGLMSLELAIRKLNPNMTDSEIENELRRVKGMEEEKNLMNTPLNQTPFEESENRLNE